MSKTIPLPNGQSAQLREPQDVSERLRRPITRAMRRVSVETMDLATAAAKLPEDSEERDAANLRLSKEASEEDTEALGEANDQLVVALVEQWSFPHPITLEGVLDLPARAYDALREAVSPMLNDLFVDASPSPEPTSPFVSSNGSDSLSTEGSLMNSLTSGAPSASSSSPDGL